VKNVTRFFSLGTVCLWVIIVTGCATNGGTESTIAINDPNLPNKEIHFTDYSYRLTETSKQYADQIAEYLSDNPDVKLKITGNIDPQLESDIYNFNLAERRAEQLKDYLITKGVAKEQVCNINNLSELNKNNGMLDTLSYLTNCS
jgi:hypothetical protein